MSLVSLSSPTASSACSLPQFQLVPLHSYIGLSCNTAIFSVGDCVRMGFCAPVCVYIAETNQQKTANPPQTPLNKQHTNTTCELSTSPTQSEILRCQLYGPWHDRMQLNKNCFCVRALVYVCASGSLMIQQGSWGEILSKRTITQSALCIQHSGSMTCQTGLWITVMDVLINAIHRNTQAYTHLYTS